MPHSLSAKKRVRQNERRRARNRTIRSRLRTARRACEKALDEGNLDAARARFRRCEQLMHRAAANGPLHRNTAGRTIARLHRRLAALERAAG
jgi:small subunit ribosomal protein S20